MLVFFINGKLDIKLIESETTDIDHNTSLYKYAMNFLTESDQESTNIIITLQDDNNNIITQEYIIYATPTNIKIDCTDFMTKYNWQDATYIKINYKITDINLNLLYNGSFPLIAPTHTTNLKFGGVSCNNNQNSYDLNDYNYKYPNNPANMWQRLTSRNLDIIFHLGNQIYADYILEGVGFTENSCNLDEIYNAYCNLYKTAYSEKFQGNSMRHGLHINILGEHDIGENFGALRDPGDLVFKSYYVCGMKAFIQYQMGIDQEDMINRILDKRENLYFNINYGKYNIIGLDSRFEAYHNGFVFSNKQLDAVTNYISRSLSQEIILLSCRPIAELNEYNALISNSVEDLFHSLNLNRTLKLLYKLDDCNRDRDRSILLFSGGVEKTYTNNVSIDGNVILNQLVVGSITRKPLIDYNMWCKIKKWIQYKFVMFCEDDFVISNKENYYTSNSFGVMMNNLVWSCVDGDAVCKEEMGWLKYNC